MKQFTIIFGGAPYERECIINDLAKKSVKPCRAKFNMNEIIFDAGSDLVIVNKFPDAIHLERFISDSKKLLKTFIISLPDGRLINESIATNKSVDIISLGQNEQENFEETVSQIELINNLGLSYTASLLVSAIVDEEYDVAEQLIQILKK